MHLPESLAQGGAAYGWRYLSDADAAGHVDDAAGDVAGRRPGQEAHRGLHGMAVQAKAGFSRAMLEAVTGQALSTWPGSESARL